jgi:hypothetical protein
MSLEINIVAWCDACAVDNEKHPATGEHGTSVVYANHNPVLIDLCDKHQQWLTDLVGRGRQPETPASTKRNGPNANYSKTNCPVCQIKFLYPTGLGTHLSRAHNMSVAERRDALESLERR